MEAKSGAEVRRLHIVYFLTRKSGIEHPHLIRVHHLSRNGVRLRDIKRWLRELRGNDMPESYSWSYKRRYRAGYVWQDLEDDDLITPISDNEYVLKGSEISSAIINTVSKVPIEKDQTCLDEDQKAASEYQNQSHPSTHISTKSSEIEEEYPVFGSETSTLTDDSLSLETQKSIITDGIKQEKLNEKPTCDGKIENNSKKRSNKVKIDEKITKHAASSTAAPRQPNFSKSKICSHGASGNIFRNMISCGAIYTNDSATVTINKSHRPFFNICPTDQKTLHSAEIRERDRKIGVPHRIYDTPWLQKQLSGRNNGVKDSTEDKEESKGQSQAPAASYKPINLPNCSQCGKPFRPEKLHAHMKSCKGLKALAKNAYVDKKIKKKSSTENRNEDSISACDDRRYRTGYVWQDLQDDDLITPISDNEYVFKGSEISSPMMNTGISKVSIEKEQKCLDEDQKAAFEYQINQSHPSAHISTKSSSEIEEEYPVFGSETSTLTDDSLNLETQKSSMITTDGIKQEKLNEKLTCDGKIENNSKKRSNKVKIDEKITKHAASSTAAPRQPNFSKSKSCSHGTSGNIFRNMISCGAIDTNDSATVTINKNHRPFFNICPMGQKTLHSAEICKRDRKTGAPLRIYDTPWLQKQLSGRNNEVKDATEDKEESKGQSQAPAAAYKPISLPNCSQCGKPFKPEKQHAHMKSCKGLKALAKNAYVDNVGNNL